MVQRYWKVATVVLTLMSLTALYVTYTTVPILSPPVGPHYQQQKQLFAVGTTPDDETTISSRPSEVLPTATNRTLNRKLLIYNRVPKCGSTTMVTLLRRLGVINHYTHHSSKIYDKHRLSDDQELKFIKDLYHIFKVHPRGVSIDRHIYFINFTRHGFRQPIYINVLRDPVDRVVSSFYYLRSPERWLRLEKEKKKTRRAFRVDKIMSKVPQRWLHKDFGRCVLSGDPECSYVAGTPKETIVSFFCGSDQKCLLVNNQEALQRAKYNIEMFYSVVGIVEDLEKSMFVFENYVPRFFRFMRREFNRTKQDWKRRNATPHPEPTEEVRNRLRQNLTAEIEIYNFAVQRLNRQFQALQSSGKGNPTPAHRANTTSHGRNVTFQTRTTKL